MAQFTFSAPAIEWSLAFKGLVIRRILEYVSLMLARFSAILLVAVLSGNAAAWPCGDDVLPPNPEPTSLEDRLRGLNHVFIGRVKGMTRTPSTNGSGFKFVEIAVEFEVLWPVQLVKTLNTAHRLKLQTTVSTMVLPCIADQIAHITMEIGVNETWLIAGDLDNRNSFRITAATGEAELLSDEQQHVVDILKDDRQLK